MSAHLRQQWRRLAERSPSRYSLADVRFDIEDTSRTWIAGRFDVVAYIDALSPHLPVGRMTVTEFTPGGTYDEQTAGWYVGNTAVLSELQRKGIASAMLAIARQRVGEVKFHDSEFTPDGAAWATSQGHTVRSDSGWREGDMTHWVTNGSLRTAGVPAAMSAHLRERWGALVTAGLTPEMLAQVDAIRDRHSGGGFQRTVCGHVSAEIARVFGWPVVLGWYGSVLHAWNALPDGTILDATADQFGHPVPRVTRDPRYRPFTPVERRFFDAWIAEHGCEPDAFDMAFADEDVTARLRRTMAATGLTFEESARTITAYRDGVYVGEITLDIDPSSGSVYVVQVTSQQKRQGIAEALLVQAHRRIGGRDIVINGFLSHAGAKWAVAMTQRHPWVRLQPTPWDVEQFPWLGKSAASGRVFFHATYRRAWERIRVEGLRPRPGAPGIWLFPSLARARRFAEQYDAPHADESFTGGGVVLRVVADAVEIDRGIPGSFASLVPIPPEHITEVGFDKIVAKGTSRTAASRLWRGFSVDLTAPEPSYDRIAQAWRLGDLTDIRRFVVEVMEREGGAGRWWTDREAEARSFGGASFWNMTEGYMTFGVVLQGSVEGQGSSNWNSQYPTGSQVVIERIWLTFGGKGSNVPKQTIELPGPPVYTKTAYSRDWAAIVRTWPQVQPWKGTKEDHESQSYDGIYYQSKPRGTEVASFTPDNRIAVGDAFLAYPESTRRAILYHEAGHALETKAGFAGLRAAGVDSPLDMVNWPGSQGLGFDYSEIIAEGYSVLWSEPEWFERMGAQRIRDVVTTLARQQGFPLP